MSRVKNLLILGNGFDLSCNLASTYADFFNKRYSQDFIELFNFNRFKEGVLSLNVNLREIVKDYGLLDFILLLNTNQTNKESIRWADIETIILSVFSENSLTIDNLAKGSFDIYGKKKRPFIFNNESIFDKLYNREIFFNSTDFPEELKKDLVLQLINAKDIGATVTDEQILKKVLIDEFTRNLNEIEESFKQYLQEEVESKDSYYMQNTEWLYNTLVSDFENTYLITFNYTRLDTTPNKTYIKPFYEENHVHGEIGTEREIIFGVDENYLESDSEYFQFTKTYRKLLLDAKRPKIYKKLPNEIGNLVFYGHSLSHADYAYFYSIFDFYEIYNSETNIIFVYNDYLADGSNTILSEYVSNITKLFNSYSKNSNFTTKNLLHKLNLEGRVLISKLNIKYEGTKIISSQLE